MKFSECVGASSTKCIKTGLNRGKLLVRRGQGIECLMVHRFKWSSASLYHLPKYVLAHSGSNLLKGKNHFVFGRKGDYYFFFHVMSQSCFREAFVRGLSLAVTIRLGAAAKTQQQNTWTTHFAVYYRRLQGKWNLCSVQKRICANSFFFIFGIWYILELARGSFGLVL